MFDLPQGYKTTKQVVFSFLTIHYYLFHYSFTFFK